MFEVVQHQQHFFIAQIIEQLDTQVFVMRKIQSDRLSDCGDDRRWCCQRSQRYKVNTMLEILYLSMCTFNREMSLHNTPEPGDGDQTVVGLFKPGLDLLQLFFPANQGCQGRWKIGWLDGF